MPAEIFGRGIDFENVAFVLHVICTSLDHNVKKLLFRLRGFIDYKVTLFIEHPCDRAGLTKVAAVL